MATIAMHVRENKSWSASLEKHMLIWMAEHMPAWVGSDHLTLLGFSGTILAGISYWQASTARWPLCLVVLSLAINWFGDSLDGTLARVRNAQRPRYGYYVDHILDILGTCCLLVGLALSGYMTPIIAVGMLATFLVVDAEVFLATHVRRTFRMSFLGFGPTELRIILAIGTLFLFFKPRVHIANYGPYLLFDIGGVIAIAGMGVAVLTSAARNAVQLYREEPLPGQTRSHQS